LGCFTLTAGGDFHPALRTSAARHERPEGTMANGRDASKHLRMGNPHVPMPPARAWRRTGPSEINAGRAKPTRGARNRVA
jgi:hypothetical protein